jgi:hypothetical protein
VEKLKQMQKSKQTKAFIMEKTTPSFIKEEKSGTKRKSIFGIMRMKPVINTLNQ